METGRNEYNKVLANTNDEETLLNLVRRRYADSIAVLEVNSVFHFPRMEKKILVLSLKFLMGEQTLIMLVLAEIVLIVRNQQLLIYHSGVLITLRMY